MSAARDSPRPQPAAGQHKYSPLLRENLIEWREYQESIALKAVQKNTLVVLPTALGKTVIALISLSILIEGGGKCIFLAPTRPLVHQHATSMRTFLNLPEEEIVEVTGEVDRSLRADVYRKGRVIVSTPQVIDNDSDILEPMKDQVKVVIFDEAHRATGDYSYVAVAEFFNGSRIIATTASPGSDRQRIDEIIRHLRINHLEIRDEKSPDVVKYIKGMDIRQVRIRPSTQTTRIISSLREVMDDRIEKLNAFGFHIQGHSRKEILEIGDVISQQIREGNSNFFGAMKYRTSAILVDYLIEFMETQGALPFYEYFNEVRNRNAQSKALFKDARMISVESATTSLLVQPLDVHTPKMAEVIRILRHNGGKAIVFCHYRLTANLLSNVLRQEGFLCEKFIGQSDRKREKGMSQYDQASVLQEFREGTIQVLVATQVGEEGLDVPAADTVIFYEPVASEVRSIQRRGRTGRFARGNVYILTMEDSRDMAYYYSAIRKENRMKDVLNDDIRHGDRNAQQTMDSFWK